LGNCGAGTCGDGDEVLAGTTTSTITGTYSFTGLADGNYAVLINPGDPSITSLTPTTPTSYDVSGDPWVSFAPGCSVGGGCTAIRDFGLNSNLDFGDLPDIYNRTLLAEYGARHPIAGGSLRLGVLIDSDLDGQESLAADGDDNDGIDDDDGIVIPTGGTWGDGTVELDATAANGSGCLIGWVDYNGDGDFADTQADGFGAGTPELMFVRFLSTGTTQVIFPSPESTVGSGTYVYPASLNMRFRLFPANDVLFTANTIALDGNGCPSGLNSTLKMASLTVGLASSGEVEDYQQTFAPTAVTLQNISAAAPTVWTLIIATLMTLTLVSFMLVHAAKLSGSAFAVWR
jgi:hypothetical protein